MTKGLLISFEGPDGAGKTSILEALLPLLEQEFKGPIVKTREPGGIDIAEKIREVILDVKHTSMDKKTELLLYIAARRQHMVERVLPALEKGALVLVDRFIDSSLAYQGHGRGLDQEAITWLNAYATDQRKPDLTLLFDVDSETGLARIQSNSQREVNRLDLEALEMHERVRSGYLELAAAEPDRFVIIDASQDFQAVLADSLAVIAKKLGE